MNFDLIQNPEPISLKDGICYALSKTFSWDFLRVIGVWSALSLLCAVLITVFLGISTKDLFWLILLPEIAISVAWTRFLFLGEPIPLIRFGRLELYYLGWLVRVVLFLVLICIPLLAIPALFMSASAIETLLSLPFIVLLLPYLSVFFFFITLLPARAARPRVRDVLRSCYFPLFMIAVLRWVLPEGLLLESWGMLPPYMNFFMNIAMATAEIFLLGIGLSCTVYVMQRRVTISQSSTPEEEGLLPPV